MIGSARLLKPMSNYEKWLARPLAVLPASDLLSFVYEKCEQIRRGSDNPDRAKSRNASAFSPHVEHNDGTVNDPGPKLVIWPLTVVFLKLPL